MRRLVLAGPLDLRLEEIEPPEPAAGEVLLGVVAAGVCGSDLHGYRGANDRRRPGTVMGHEVAGRVEGLGAGVEAAWLGRTVAVNPVLGCERCPACRSGAPQRCPDKVLIGCVPEHPGGFAELVVAPVTSLVAWSGPAPGHWAALAEPLAVGLQAVDRAELRGRDVLVIGSGPVAVGAAWAAGRRGAATVTLTVTDGRRRDLLRSLGLTTVPQDQLPAAGGFEVVLDCVASAETLEAALQQVPIGGSVVVVGLAAPTAPISVERLVQGDRALLGSAQYSRGSFATAVRWLSDGRLDVAPLLGEPQPLARGPELFRRWAETEDGGAARPLRTLLVPG